MRFPRVPVAPRPVLILLIAAVASVGAAQETVQPLRLADWPELVYLEDPQTVPRTDRVVFQVDRVELGSDGWISEVWESAPGEEPRRLLTDATAPRPSPDGRWLAFLRTGNVWLMSWSGGEPRQLTRGRESYRSIVWSPDSTRLAMVALDPQGPAPELVPEDERSALAAAPPPAVGGVAPPPLEGAWEPAVAEEPVPVERPAEPTDAAEEIAEPERPERDRAAPRVDRPLPRVIRRLQFKADGEGYLGPRRPHLWVLDLLAAEEGPVHPRRLTGGLGDDSDPTWSPDGRWIAFASSRGTEPDATTNTEIWAVRANGGEPVRITATADAEAAPAWSPDGRWLAYRFVPAEPPVYAAAGLRLTDVEGLVADGTPPDPELAEPVELTAALDRPVLSTPVWAADLAFVYATIEDRGTQPLVRISTGLDPASNDRRRRRRAPPLPAGSIAAVLAGPRAVAGFAFTEAGGAALLSTPTDPVELYRFPRAPTGDVELPLVTPTAHVRPAVAPPAASLTRATSFNAAWRRRVQLSDPEPLRFESDEGVFVEGWLLRPPGAVESERLPLIVLIHGGPVSQFAWDFSWEKQWLAAQGYAVLYINPRGSSGYGESFAVSLWADWGGPDLRDVLAGIEHLESRAVIDPERIGVGGWSYGGILTNYLITRTDRFAAAVSGASETDAFSAYGTDDLQRWWEDEIGLPWDPEARRVYEELSAIRDVERIVTPTLFMGGELDWRVPLSQSEQMYTQLRRRMVDGGPETALIVYPGESHGITRPSFMLDRWLRMKAWYDRHVLGDPDADPFFGEWAW
jgi:dipeptidyl aminopeptidase/acylaminoacyl peptidase